MAWLNDPDLWASLLTLTALEIVLGIDNIIFLSIVTSGLAPGRRRSAQRLGLALALILRVVFLVSIAWIIGLTAPIFTAFDHSVSWRDIILIGGGLFLLYKGTLEIHHDVEGRADAEEERKLRPASYAAVIGQIIVLDVVFSLNSIITAVGMTDNVPVMIAAVVIAIAVMMFAAGPVGDFIQRHPTTKMLGLSFLLLVGVALIADGFHFHIPREYLYFAIAFSALVEGLNILAKERRRRARRALMQDGG